jgi:hypothetical protein
MNLLRKLYSFLFLVVAKCKWHFLRLYFVTEFWVDSYLDECCSEKCSVGHGSACTVYTYSEIINLYILPARGGDTACIPPTVFWIAVHQNKAFFFFFFFFFLLVWVFCVGVWFFFFFFFF